MSAVLAPRANRYSSLYDRLVASTKLVGACWEWTGATTGGYPKITLYTPRGPRSFWAHRLMLQEVLRCYFPFDHAGHLCGNTLCVNPDHLEVQTPAHNYALRRGYTAQSGKSWIPVLFPWDDIELEAVAADDACPF